MGNMKRVVLVTVFLALIAIPLQLLAESSSESYILWGSAVTAGGNRSTSSNYINYVSVGDLSNNPLNSESFHGVIGLEALFEEPVFTMSLSTHNITLAPEILTTSTVSTADVTITISTNADFGYSLTATELTAMNNGQGHSLADVSDGAVTAGFEEFGIAVSGADAAFADDQGLSGTPLTVASRNIWGADRVSTIIFKAAISPVTDSGNYQGSFVFIGTGNY